MKTFHMSKRTEVLLNKLVYCAVMSAVVFAAAPVFAGEADFGTTINTFRKDELGNVPALISGFSYIGGIGMMVAGSLGLKQHAESPGQNKLTPPIAKLLVGAGLVGLPTFANWVSTSSQIGGDAVTYTSVTGVS